MRRYREARGSTSSGEPISRSSGVENTRPTTPAATPMMTLTPTAQCTVRDTDSRSPAP